MVTVEKMPKQECRFAPTPIVLLSDYILGWKETAYNITIREGDTDRLLFTGGMTTGAVCSHLIQLPFEANGYLCFP